MLDMLRRLDPGDFEQVVTVYQDAVISQARGLYSAMQIQAWAMNATGNDGVRQALREGYGLASCRAGDPTVIEAFALLHPADRLSLLYCRGRACRQGRATALLAAIERRARESGCHCLRTEASQLSRPLLERLGWRVEAEEEVILMGEWFLRWRMIKDLVPPSPPPA
jgi:GNAT superfamily N-acetyltransferase